MAWEPQLNIIKTRLVASNVLAYITDATRQADAYTWAGDSSLKLIKTVSSSVANRSKPFYPSIAFSDDNDAQNFDADVLIAAYSFTFEVSVQNADPDAAVTNAKVYSAAMVSMIRNCPDATIIAGTGAFKGAIIHSIEVGFEQIKTNERQNDFLQQFQVRTALELGASYK